MPKERIGMSTHEMRTFLSERRMLVLATVSADGTPSGSVHRYRLEGEDIVFALPRGAASLENLRRDQRACAIVEHFPEYYAIKGVSVHGRAVLVEQDGSTTARLPLDDVVSFDFSKIRDRR